ncbi:hypothetical protein Y919_02155 [Caloranaerobacter azorensis H53214]|uniref:Anti-sigma-W factor RsiW n=1 Tax=Caloranaerobacter azorensis H53214 TaxID=1156417 RepID=A0A096BKD3_9FIRM|nr:DUF4349 domain-containing protein [Caloranaerobacter azorensis]KGG81208.1 hypothetical protein Y919_02155 [Caloranaerobacter azorensis H53214]
MDCKSFEEKISLYIDDMLDEAERDELELHLKKCNKCRILFENINSIVNYAKDCEEIELPEDFNEKLKIRLKEVEKPKSYKNRFKILSMIAATFLVVIISISIFTSNNSKIEESSMYYTKEAAIDAQMSKRSRISQPKLDRSKVSNYDASNGMNMDKGNVKQDKLEKRKIINEAYIELDIEDYDKVFNEIIDYVKSLGGFIEDSEVEHQNSDFKERKEPLKRGYLRIRVPSDKFEDAIKYIDGLGIIKRKSLTGRDVTQQYYDIENRVKNLKIQEERLREILRKAEKVEDILMIENELRRVRTEIDQNTSTLKKWDNLVSLATINVRLNEVETLNKRIKNVDKNIFEKSKEGFITTINNIINLFEKTIVFLITILPIIILIFILFMIAYFLYKKKH